MTKSLTLLWTLFMCLKASKSYLRGSVSAANSLNADYSSSLLNLDSADQSMISLTRSPQGFVLSTDLSADNLNDGASKTAKVLLALYTNETVLFNYNCSQYQSCHIDPSHLITKDLPYFVAEGYYASADASLSSGNWKLSSSAILNKSSEEIIQNNDTVPSGFIGMGLGGDAKSNFENQLSFSIFLTPNAEQGQLLFTPDMTLADSTTPVATVPVDSNWHVNNVDSIGIGSLISLNNTSLIFDLNSDTIGLPLSIFNQLMDSLASQYGFTCSSDTYQPVCSNYDYKKTLPPLTINIGDQALSLPYDIYLQGGDSDIQSYEMVLNIKALASNLTGDCYVTPTYENYIVLNYHVLSYYYTVFDGDNQTIVLYTANHSKSMNYILYIILGWFGFFILLALCYYCYMRIKMTREARARPLEEDGNSIQESLMRNSEAADAGNNQVPNQEQTSSQTEIVN